MDRSLIIVLDARCPFFAITRTTFEPRMSRRFYTYFFKLRAAIQNFGWVDGLLYGFAWIVQKLPRSRFLRFYIMSQPVVADAAPSHPPSRGRIQVQVSTVDSPEVSAFPRSPDLLSQRFDRRDVCISAMSGNRFAGFLWFARNHFEEDDIHCRYQLCEPHRSVWDYDAHIEPEFRVGRVFSRLWAGATQHLASENIGWCFSSVLAFNPESRRAHMRLGARPLFSANFLCIGRFQVAALGAWPYLHVSSGKHSPLRIDLSPPRDG